MGEWIDRDQEHLRLIEIGFYVMSGTIAFISLFALLYMGIGIIFVMASLPRGGPNDIPPAFLGGIFIGIGAVFLVFGLGFAWLTFYAARGVKIRQRRILALVMAGLFCLQIPWGTVFGVLAIIVLNRPSVAALFDQPPPMQMGPPALH
jgi:hypothetical protein